MFKEEDRLEVAEIAKEEIKKESVFNVLLTRLFPIIVRLAEKIALKYLQKRGWI